ncbi:unnamed protein product [Clonostachys byssicola]|uniref:Uncharacterized protein n=1 Tax=Clonostachys byssicola TaxID=160290 RepID=A0A9N9UP02_9HYPO|nr:unnamed protein product [Clonostachys byssicola]
MVLQTKTLKNSRPSEKRTKRGTGLDHDSEPLQKRPRQSLRLNPPTPTKRGTKRNVETPDSVTPQKQSRRSPIEPPTAGTTDRPTDPIEFWAKERPQAIKLWYIWYIYIHNTERLELREEKSTPSESTVLCTTCDNNSLMEVH